MIKSRIVAAATFGLFLAAMIVPWRQANAQCPPTGADSVCGALITITNAGASISFSGQGPYDGFDDTLVGVVNNSAQPIFAMGLSSLSNIFGFDGDGLATFGTPGNGYAGPNVTLTSTNAGATSGIVKFTTPLAPNGGNGSSAYFSLENSLTKPTAIQNIVNGAINVTLGGRFEGTPFGTLNQFRPTNISATFKPNGGLTLAQAAQQTGFKAFNFQQTITNWPSPSNLFAVGSNVGITTPPSFLDPPPGGYQYCVNTFPACLTSYPFYPTTQTADTLNFFDSPRDPLLPSGSQLVFATELIGELPAYQSGTNTDCLKLATPTCIDLGVGFKWTSTYNGSLGGVAITASNQPIDPATADGFGGLTLTDVQELTNYAPFGVTTINGSPVTMLPTDLNQVPEPASIILFGSAVMLLGFARKRKQKEMLA